MKTVFVSIASFRDILCSQTIRSMFDMAKYPSRIFAGICEQNDPRAKDEICKSIEKYASNIRKLTVHYKQAKDPTLTRYPFDPHLDYLFMGEEMLLSIRSFTFGWNVYTPNRNIVFHTYTRSSAP